jgi:hypothetical protein
MNLVKRPCEQRHSMGTNRLFELLLATYDINQNHKELWWLSSAAGSGHEAVVKLLPATDGFGSGRTKEDRHRSLMP